MPLIPLEEYQELVGSYENPALQLAALEAASQAILNYTDRDFGNAAEDDEDRVYQYNGRGLLEIDDASIINSVTFASQLLPNAQWRAGFEGPSHVGMYDYVELPTFSSLSGEMGFMYNLDAFLTQGAGVRTINVTVNADWGWPDVPEDVKRGLLWTAASFQSDITTLPAGALTARSVAEVSESYAVQAAIQRQTTDGEEALPTRARGILAPYKRMTMP